MSSDEYFDDELDSAFLNEFDAIDAAHTATPAAPSHPTTTGFKPTRSAANAPKASSSKALLTGRATPPDVIDVHDSSSDYGFDDFPADEVDFARIDQACERELNEYQRTKGQGPAQSSLRPSTSNGLARRPSKGAQLTLFGEVAQEAEPSKAGEPSHRSFQRTRSALRQMPLPGQAKKTKQWDRTAYAKTGWRKPKPKSDQANSDEEENVEFEQFPAPEVPVGPAPPMKLSADRLAARTWLYPLNKPKRDYQYNIVKQCLLENTLVALPTGLGKTFIAGVVMLNYYNWFPHGKVAFVAPTKPLVAQQIDACHKTCGIPGSAAAELTGSVSKGKRIQEWQSKRVFYATPQTFLNDLLNGNVDALDIILLVIDEAHRGTGDYAYAQLVRYMMQHNPHFRILALTATPGGKPEAVQEIVDALHISHIEIRSESDPDLKKYLHTKFEQEHFVQMTDDIVVLRDALASLMVPLIKSVQSAGFLKNENVTPTMLHPFRCQATLGEMKMSRAPQYAFSAVSQLGTLARAMGYLMENSVTMCYEYLKAIMDGTDDSGAKKNLRKGEGFKNLFKKFEEQASRGLSMHPKMDVLRTLLIDHFAKQLPDEEGATNTKQSRAMVFVSFRECVEEIVELLNKEVPIIRAKPFIGQGIDKKGKKGYAQKQQLEVIEQFKAGVYNVLVSTSIGEEGLDIGEVDVIVCYDAQKTPIRMLQRIGRTGRKASGTVHILLAKGREEHNWQKAQSSYAEVQHFIVRASDLEVYGDVDRLIPNDIEPECVEMVMDIEEYVRKNPLATTKSPKGKKRKRDDDPMRNVPASAAFGFLAASKLVPKSGAKRKKLTNVDIEHADEDDSDDEEIEAGIYGPRRTQSASAAMIPAKGKKKTLTRSATTTGPSKAKKKTKTTKQTTLTQFDLNSDDDSDDQAIECGLLASKKPAPVARKKQPEKSSRSPPSFRSAKDLLSRSSSPDVPLNDITPERSQHRSTRAMFDSSPEKPIKNARFRRNNVIDSSPERPHLDRSRSGSPKAGSSSHTPETSTSPTSRSASAVDAAVGNDSMAWLIEDDDDDLMIPDANPPASPPGAGRTNTAKDFEPLFLESSPSAKLLQFPYTPTTSQNSLSSKRSKGDMGPPALPARIAHVSPSFSDDLPPEPTFAVRAPGRAPRKRIAVEVLDLESSPLAPPPLSQKRLQRDRPCSPSPEAQPPPKKRKRKFKNAAEVARHNPWVELEATHSGDERSAGGSSEPETVLDSDDRMFVDEPLETQMSPSYDQSAVYRQSLLTQVPGGRGPVFANRPVRRGQAAFGPSRSGRSTSRAGYRRGVSSSPAHPDDEPDEYVFGSFVVDDDAEISYSAGGPSSDF
ncbi:hypothetical protein C8Q80DRAFT_1281665 [Daedaleopsis nitida]|nr:hypothetical protein C8Q80DRAFT_1281665 [Daedaleopsis nitida]